MKRAALYIRVSTDEQAKHGFSLAEQKHDLEQYARAHHYNVVNVYADEGSSARKSITRRKGLQRLLDDVRAGQIDIILLQCLDRWFRNVRDFYKVQDVLDQHGVNWECTQEDYNTTTTNGRLMLNLKLSIAQNESDQTSDRIKYVHQGMLRKHEELSGNHPFGYEIKDKHLVIVEKERPVVEFIFQQILSGYSDEFQISSSVIRIVSIPFDQICAADYNMYRRADIVRYSVYLCQLLRLSPVICSTYKLTHTHAQHFCKSRKEADVRI